jgi:hypothetical protein
MGNHGLRTLLQAGKKNNILKIARQKLVRCIAKRRKLFSAPLLLDRVPDHRRHIRPAQPRDGADAGGRGDVDLGEVADDHVDADE